MMNFALWNNSQSAAFEAMIKLVLSLLSALFVQVDVDSLLLHEFPSVSARHAAVRHED